MAHLLIQFAKRLLIPLGCLTLAIALLWLAPKLTEEQISLLVQLPYVLLALAVAMTTLANHSRQLAASINMLLSYWIIRTFLQASLVSEPAGLLFTLLAICLPLLFLLVLLVPDTGWRHPVGILTIASGPLLTLLIAWIYSINPGWLAALVAGFDSTPFHELKIAPLAGKLFAVGFLLNIILLAVRNDNTESSLLGCSLFAFLTLGWFHLPHVSASMFASAGLLLILNQMQNLLHVGYRDELTQIPNRRALHDAARSLSQNYALAMIDIDHFKKINDDYGHDLGDQVLKVVAGKLKQVGDGGKAYRYGGEEFCLLFRGRIAEDVTDTLEGLRRNIADYSMLLRDKKNRPRTRATGQRLRGATRRSDNIRITISIGAADTTKADNFHDVMKVADKAMYRAKRGGRNRVVLA